MPRIAEASFVLALALPGVAQAQDYPKFVADGHFELRFDIFPQSDLVGNERLDVNLHGDANIGFYLNRELSLQSTLKVESVRDPHPGRDRYINGTALFLEQLYVDYGHDDFGLYAGKFNPTFGMAWAKLPELLREEFSEEYETTEMIGLGGSLKFGRPSGWGKHEFNAAAFFVDTTFLHASLFASPDMDDERAGRLSNLRRRDGGPGNTGRLNNFSATLDGGEFEFAPGLFYHLGVRHLSRGRTELKDETAYVAGVGYRFEFSDGSALTPLIEHVHFDNFEGGLKAANMLTVGLTLALEKWISASRLRAVISMWPASTELTLPTGWWASTWRARSAMASSLAPATATKTSKACTATGSGSTLAIISTSHADPSNGSRPSLLCGSP